MHRKNNHNFNNTSEKYLERPGENAIDMEILDALRKVMEDGFSELLNLFINSVPEQITSLSEYTLKNDAKNISKIAHSLKSSSATLGALAFSARCKDLETTARSGITANHPKKIKGLEMEFLRVKKVLESASQLLR